MATINATAPIFSKMRDNYPAPKSGLADTIVIAGNFIPGTTTAQPSAVSNGPFDVKRTGTGRFTVTFQEPMQELLASNVTLHQATGGTKAAYQVVSTTVLGTASTGASISIETDSTLGTAADLGTGVRVEFTTIWRKGQLTK